MFFVHMLFACSVLCEIMETSAQFSNSEGRPLIVMAVPSPRNTYYAASLQDIINFQIEYAKSIIGKDNVIVLGDKEALNLIGGRLPADVLLEASIEDIWMRDFSPAHMSEPTLFSYRPNYLNRRLARLIQASLESLLARCQAEDYSRAQLIVDGGNVVDNDVDKAILTSRVYADNYWLSRQKVKQQLTQALGYAEIAIIPETPGDTTGHSDGMVSFVDTNVIAITAMTPGEESAIQQEFQSAFANSPRTFTINSHYKDEVWRGFSSACGLHINLLATTDFLYVPTFGSDPENRARGQNVSLDSAVLAEIGRNTEKTVVPVPVPYKVCRMGGSVRCLSWQVAGSIADTLVRMARSSAGCPRNNGWWWR